MTEPQQRTSAPRRRRRWGGLVRWLATLLVLVLVSSLVAFALWVRSEDFQHRVRPLLVDVVEHQTGERFEVERVQVRLWPPSVTLVEPRLWHEPTGESIVTADRVRAPLVLRDGGVALGRLTLDTPVVELHLEQDGRLRELRDAVRGGRPMERLPWSSLALNDGVFRLHVPEGRFVLSDLQVIPTHGARADVTASIVLWKGRLEDRAGLAWHDVTLGPEVVEIPDLVLDTTLIGLEGAARLELPGTIEARLAVRTDLSRFDPLLGAPRALSGTAGVDVEVTGTTRDPVARAQVHGEGLVLVLPALSVPVVHYRFGDLAAEVLATREGAWVERAVLDTGVGVAEVQARILPDLTVADAIVTGDGLGLEHLLKAMDAAPTPWVDLRGDVLARVSGTLNPLRLEGPFEIEVTDWRVADRPIADPAAGLHLEIPRAVARGNLLLEKDHVLLHAPLVEFPRSRGRAEVDIGFGPKGPLDLHADLTRADLSDLRPLGGSELTGTGTIRGRLHGPFNQLSFQGHGVLDGFSVSGIPYADHLESPIASPDMKSIVLTGARARVGQTPYTGDFTLDFRDPMALSTDIAIPEGRVEDLLGMFLELPGVDGDLQGSLVLDGPLYDLDGEAHLTLSDVGLFGERFPAGEAHGYMDDGVFTLDDLRVLRDEDRAGILLRGSVQRQWALNMELVADGFRLADLDHLREVNLPVSGRASAVVRVDNTLFEPAPHGRLALTDVRYAGVPVADSSLGFETTHGVTHFEGKLVGGTVAVVGHLGLWQEQPYSLFASFVDFPVHLLYPVAADGEPVRGRLSGRLELGGHFGDRPSPLDLEAQVTELHLGWRRHELHNASTWRYAQHGPSFRLEDFHLAGGKTDLILSHATGGPEGLDFAGLGRIDLDLLRAVVPDLLRSEGHADLVFTAAGQGQVDALVEAEVYGSLMRHASFPEAFEDVRASVRATRDGYHVLDLVAGLGGGQVTGGGRIAAEGWIPERYNLAARASDVQVQWIDALPPAVGDADIRFDGPVHALLLSGNVQVREMLFEERIDWEDWVVDYRDWTLVGSAPTEEEPLFSLDVGLTADRTILLRNNVAEGVASADLRVIGDTARPGLVGRVTVDDAIAILQDREFHIERGVLAYRDPWTWDPDLDFELVTDIESRERSYRVHYLVRGPFSDWRTETRSEPALAQADINALLWFGVTADDLEGMGELPQAVAQGVADMILTDLFITRGSGVREEIGGLVDRVEIATGVDSRGEYSSDPRLVVEKRFEEADVTVAWEWNTTRWSDQLGNVEWRLTDSWSLAGWYASRQRDRVLAIGGAWGLDVRGRWEME